MPAVQETVDRVRRIDVDQYRYGFETNIESEKAPKGLSEDTVRFISAKKNEPAWMLDTNALSELIRNPGGPMVQPIAAAILAHVDKVHGEQWANYFEFAFFAGLRPSEQIALGWPKVDFRRGEVRVDSARVRTIDKRTKTHEARDVELAAISPTLHGFQAEIVQWACRIGRAAIWADTGMGKTFMQIEWARHMAEHGTALIVAPLAVCQQTVREAAKLGIHAEYVRDGQMVDGLTVTNYEMLDHFDPDTVTAVVLDEASILKSSDGKTRTKLIEWAARVPYRLSCTATPAPNDPEELTNQAEFLGHMDRTHMLAAYFIHDDQGWRLKGHARQPMFEWMSTWAVAIRKPSDLGYADTGYNLPGLDIVPEIVESNIEAEGQLFATDLGGVGGRAKIRRETLAARVARCAELVNAERDEPWLIWCGLNDEANAIAKATGGFNVHGSMTPEEKADALLGFADGSIPILITKPGIASQGLNYQHCARMAFVGLSDSYEQYYQSIRRCYRYGQKRVVRAHIILSELEAQIASNVARKEREASLITSGLVAEMRRARATERTAS